MKTETWGQRLLRIGDVVCIRCHAILLRRDYQTEERWVSAPSSIYQCNTSYVSMLLYVFSAFLFRTPTTQTDGARRHADGPSACADTDTLQTRSTRLVRKRCMRHRNLCSIDENKLFSAPLAVVYIRSTSNSSERITPFRSEFLPGTAINRVTRNVN